MQTRIDVTDGDVARLTVVPSYILQHQCRIEFKVRCGSQIDSMLGHIGFVLRRIEFDPRVLIVHMKKWGRQRMPCRVDRLLTTAEA